MDDRLNDKICIFTGAGFSRALFDQKIQVEFCKDFLESEESQCFINFLSVNIKRLIKSIDDIELVMSHIYNLGHSGANSCDRTAYSKNEIREYTREIIFFRTALAIYFKRKFESVSPEHYKRNCEIVHKYFERQGVTRENLIVITTNYDLGFEYILEDYFGKNCFFHPVIDTKIDKSKSIPVLKLHGSIDWMEDRGEATNKMFANGTRGSKSILKEALSQAEFVPLREEEGFALVMNNRKYSPILFPFFYQKKEWEDKNNPWWGEIFRSVKNMAQKAMINADQVHFWGYGLPSADHHQFSQLYTALGQKYPKCTVVDYKSAPDQRDSNMIRLARYLYSGAEDKLSIKTNGLISYLEGQ